MTDLSSLVTTNPRSWDSAAPQWQMVYADLDGNNLADITDVSDRQFNFPLNSAGTITGKMNLLHPAIGKVLGTKPGLVKLYKHRQLAMVAETSTFQLSGSGSERSLVFVATEAPWVRLDKRRIGRAAEGVTYTSLDRGEIARQIVESENDRYETGIRTASITASSTVTAGPWYVKKASEAIKELGNSLYGYDVWFDPHDPADDPTDVLAYMNIAPVRGGERENAVFEYGTGRANMRDYEWLIDMQAQINVAISLPPGYPDNLGLTLIQDQDLASVAAIGLREDTVENELVDDTLRAELVEEHVTVRKVPRNLYKFNPHYDDQSGRVPQFLVDYNLGDVVRARVDDANVLQIDGLVRVYGVQVNLDSQGGEEVTLTVVEEEA